MFVHIYNNLLTCIIYNVYDTLIQIITDLIYYFCIYNFVCHICITLLLLILLFRFYYFLKLPFTYDHYFPRRCP